MKCANEHAKATTTKAFYRTDNSSCNNMNENKGLFMHYCKSPDIIKCTWKHGACHTHKQTNKTHTHIILKRSYWPFHSQYSSTTWLVKIVWTVMNQCLFNHNISFKWEHVECRNVVREETHKRTLGWINQRLSATQFAHHISMNIYGRNVTRNI